VNPPLRIKFHPSGQVRMLYNEIIGADLVGPNLDIRRASYVEPISDGPLKGQWIADLTVSGGPVLGPVPLRSDALRAEKAWLEQHAL